MNDEVAIRQRIHAFLTDAQAWNESFPISKMINDDGIDYISDAETDKERLARIHGFSSSSLEALTLSHPFPHSPDKEIIQKIDIIPSSSAFVETLSEGAKFEYQMCQTSRGWRIEKFRQVFGDKDLVPNDAIVLKTLRDSPRVPLQYTALPEGLDQFFERSCLLRTGSYRGESWTKLSVSKSLLSIPSGWIACDDPGYWYSEASTFTLPVPPGSYTLEVVQIASEIVAVKLVIRPGSPVARYAKATRMLAPDPRHPSTFPNIVEGIGVDTGTIGLADADSLYAMSLYEREKMNYIACKVQSKPTDLGLTFMPMTNGLDAVTISTGGDGGFLAYWALNDRDEAVSLIVDIAYKTVARLEEFAIPIQSESQTSFDHPLLAKAGISIRFQPKDKGTPSPLLIFAPASQEMTYAFTDSDGEIIMNLNDSFGCYDGGKGESIALLPEDFKLPVGGHLHLCRQLCRYYSIIPALPDTLTNTPEAFAQIWKKCRCEESIGEWYELIKRQYEVTAHENAHPLPRYYHNWRHLTARLIEFDEARSFFSHLDLPAIEMALWFLNIVYNPKANNNEEDSARGAALVLERGKAPEKLAEKVCALILKTKSHPSTADPDSALVLDIDLSVFGQCPEQYQDYESTLRAESSWIPWTLYAHKRRDVLSSFLNRENIYLTSYFRDRYEAQARINLQKSLDEMPVLFSEKQHV